MCIATVAPGNHHCTGGEPQQQRDLWQKVKKSVSNAKAITVTGSKNTKETIKITRIRQIMMDRKRAFGVEFLDLVLMREQLLATDRELQDCIVSARADLGRLQDKISRWERRIAENREKLDRKLHRDVGTSSGNANNAPSSAENCDDDDDESQASEDGYELLEAITEEDGEDESQSADSEAANEKEFEEEGQSFEKAPNEENVELVAPNQGEDDATETSTPDDETKETEKKSGETSPNAASKESFGEALAKLRQIIHSKEKRIAQEEEALQTLRAVIHGDEESLSGTGHEIKEVTFLTESHEGKVVRFAEETTTSKAPSMIHSFSQPGNAKTNYYVAPYSPRGFKRSYVQDESPDSPYDEAKELAANRQRSKPVVRLDIP